MNTTAINNLASFLNNIPSRYNRGFNMESYDQSNDECSFNGGEVETHVGFQCNTTACIAGWACLVLRDDGMIRAKNDVLSPDQIDSFPGTARRLLGITVDQANELFEPMNYTDLDRFKVDWNTITPRQAAKVLRHLAKTGEVDWGRAFA